MFPWRRKGRENGALVAVAFNSAGVCVARVQRSEETPPVLDACEYHAAADRDARARALVRLVRKHRLDDSACTLVMELDTYSLLLVEAPEVPPEELRAAVRWKIQDYIDFHVDDAVIDVFDVPAHKGAGKPRLMYAVAARLPMVRERAELVQDADLDLAVVDIVELAQRNIAAQLPEDASGVALLSLSDTSGLITLTRQATLYLARRLETGVRAFDELRPQDTGERLNGALQSWLDTLVVEVQRSLDYYESNFAQPAIANLVVAPFEGWGEPMTRYLAEQLGIAVRVLDLNRLVDCAQPLEAEVQARCLPAIGAALRREERTL